MHVDPDCVCKFYFCTSTNSMLVSGPPGCQNKHVTMAIITHHVGNNQFVPWSPKQSSHELKERTYIADEQGCWQISMVWNLKLILQWTTTLGFVSNFLIWIWIVFNITTRSPPQHEYLGNTKLTNYLTKHPGHWDMIWLLCHMPANPVDGRSLSFPDTRHRSKRPPCEWSLCSLQ